MIGLVDTTVRDGHQSLWSADALTTAMLAEIAPVTDRVGFHAIDFTSSTHMLMAVRAHAEDPWERIRVVRELMPETPLGFITPGMRFMAWERAPVEVMRLALRCVIRNGIRRIWVAESMNDVETDLRVSRIAKEEGADEVLVGLVYSISPVHTDEYYAARAREIAASPDVDVLNLKDPGGLLTPERVRTLVPALRSAAPSLPLEVHSHCTATMAPLVYLEAARGSERRSSAPPCGRWRTARRSPPPSRRSRTCARRASRWRSTRTRWRRCPPTSRRSPLASGGPSARRSSTTSRSTATSSRAA